MVKIAYLYNINAPSEITDELTLRVMYEKMNMEFTVPWEEGSEQNYFKMKRNSINAFHDLVLPCKGLKIRL